MLDIGEVRGRTGLTAATLRHYEAEGLIRAVARSGLRRQYDDDVLRRLAVIDLCKRAGFTLAEIRRLLERTDRSQWRLDVAAKLTDIDRAISDLQEMRTGLLHAYDCPEDDIMTCPHFLAEVDRVWQRRHADHQAS